MSQQTITVTTIVDTFVNELHPDTNYGDKDHLRVSLATNERKFAYVRGPITIPAGAAGVSGNLHLFAKTAFAPGDIITVRRVIDGWNEDRVTWALRSDKSDTNAAALTLTSGAAIGDEIVVPLDAMLADILAGAPYYGFRIETDATVNQDFYASEYPDEALHPKLDLSWVASDGVLSGLSPGDGAVISDPTPVLSFITPIMPNAVRFLIDTDDEKLDPWPGSSPAWDSGVVATNESQLDTGTAGYGGASAGVLTYWRAAAREPGNVWTQASPISSFTYRALGTVTITSPAGATFSATPQIAWTFSGVQAYAEIKLLKGGGDEIWAASVTAEQSVEVPAGIITKAEDYTAVVRVWDSYDRWGLPGAPAYAEDTQIFTYDPQEGESDPDTPDAPLTLTAVAVAGKPLVNLAWTWSGSEPEYFRLVVDGEIVPAFENISPANVIVSEGNYALAFWAGTPEVEHVYEIVAVAVGGQQSLDNPTAAATISPIGLWILAPEIGEYCFIGGQASIGWDRHEAAETYLTAEGNPKRILWARGGRHGTVTGVLVDYDDLTPAEWAAKLNTIGQLDNSRTCRVVAGIDAFDCVIATPAISATPLPEAMEVTVEVWERQAVMGPPQYVDLDLIDGGIPTSTYTGAGMDLGGP